MKLEMLEFMLKQAGYKHTFDFNPFSPYTHYGAPEPMRHFHRNIHGSGYSMHPELTRPTRTAGMVNFYHSAPALAGGAGLAVPAYLMATATAAYPEVAGPQYQSAMSGQFGIGSAGHDLIYNPGSLHRSNQTLWRQFRSSMLNPWNW